MQNLDITSTRENLFKDVDALKRDAVQLAQDVKDHAGAHVDQTKKKVNDTIVYVRDQAASHPLAVLGVVFALGFFLGLRRRIV